MNTDELLPFDGRLYLSRGALPHDDEATFRSLLSLPLVSGSSGGREGKGVFPCRPRLPQLHHQRAGGVVAAGRPFCE